jgi:hypothetical protein
VNFPDQSYSPELLHLMCIALDSAWSDQQRYCGDDIAGRALRTAMAFQIMMAVSEGERDPARLTLAALNATAGRSLHC